MARLKRKALKAHKKKHEAWQKYAKGVLAKGGKPIKFKDYKHKETESVYFKGTKRETTKSRLKRAGLSDAEIKRMGG